MQYNKKIVLRRGAVLLALMMLVSSSLFFPVSAVSLPKTVETRQEVPVRPVKVHIYYDSSAEEVKDLVPSTVVTLIESGILVETFD
ncbi:MAG: hypothetical protein ACFFE7_17000, partial [Candidatus Thorarchaeota archaeon]